MDTAPKIKGDVAHKDGLFVFWVRSRRPSVPLHTVDLEAYGCNGACDCERFQFAMEPKLRRGAKPDANLRCWHITQARLFFAAWMLQKLSAEMRAKK